MISTARSAERTRARRHGPSSKRCRPAAVQVLARGLQCGLSMSLPIKAGVGAEQAALAELEARAHERSQQTSFRAPAGHACQNGGYGRVRRAGSLWPSIGKGAGRADARPELELEPPPVLVCARSPPTGCGSGHWKLGPALGDGSRDPELCARRWPRCHSGGTDRTHLTPAERARTGGAVRVLATAAASSLTDAS